MTFNLFHVVKCYLADSTVVVVATKNMRVTYAGISGVSILVYTLSLLNELERDLIALLHARVISDIENQGPVYVTR